MAIPQNKEELLLAIRDSYKKLCNDLVDIPLEKAELKELEGHSKGTKMSAANLVAYLIGWGELVLKWHNLKENGKVVEFPEVGYKWTELGLLAQKFYADYKHYDFENLLTKLDQTVQNILQLIKHTDANRLYEVGWYKQYPMGRMIQLNTSSPYKNARSRIRKWKSTF